LVIARWRGYGSGEPVTLVAPGLGATEGEARLPASGLPGTRVVVTFGSHGHAPDAPAGYWDYGVLAGELRAVASEARASRAVGVSMGAGALIRLVSEHPSRFDRLVLAQPAALDRPRCEGAARELHALAAAVAAGDRGALRALVSARLPAEAPDVGDYVERRVEALLRLGDALRALPERFPVPDAAALSALSKVDARVLVLAGRDDPLHPVAVAEAVAAAFRHAELCVLDSPAPLLTHRRHIRSMLGAFLGARQRLA
jgi:3-oxoadipate enol-lactonase